mgnify:CR=1 FL=1
MERARSTRLSGLDVTGRRVVGRGVMGLAVMALGAVMAVGGAGCGSSGTTAVERDRADVVRGEWEEVGTSVKGRPITAMTVGQGEAWVLVVGGIHGDEREAQPSVSRLVERLSASDASSAATWRVIRDLNPDGSAMARRPNARQVDLNRNFPARNYERRDRHGPSPLSEPETAALNRVILAERPTLIVVFHSSTYGPFVNFDGPAAEAARAFADGAARVDARWRLVPEMSYATPGSLGSYYGVDQGIPVLTVEFERGQSAYEAWRAIESGFGELAAYLGRETVAREEGGEEESK